MLKLEENSPETAEESTLNFRVFTLGEDGSPMYGMPLTIDDDSPQALVYVFVSIMNSFFTNEFSVKHMVEETEAVYGKSHLPIVYACGDTIYNITRQYLYNPMKDDPVEKEKKKWKKQYLKAINGLPSQEKLLNHENITWATFEEVEEYQSFKSFTDAIVNPSLTLESLKNAFPNVLDSSNVLPDLFRDIQVSDILTNLEKIASDFIEKNKNKLTRAVKSEKNQRSNAQKMLEKYDAKKMISGEAPDLAQRTEGLRRATYSFLSNEFSVFLMLSWLTNTSFIKEKLHLQSPVLETSSTITPVFSYPISSSIGAELVFATFLKINQLYCKYSEALELHITKLAVFVDSLVPKNLNPHDMRKIESSGTSSEDSSLNGHDETEALKAEPDDRHYETEALKAEPDDRHSEKEALNAETDANAKFYKNSNNSLTLFKDEVEIIVQIVADALSRRWKGMKGELISCPHGVACAIQPLGKSRELEEENALLDDIKLLIRDAAKQAIKGFFREFNLTYNGYSFKLTVRPSDPSLKTEKFTL